MQRRHACAGRAIYRARRDAQAVRGTSRELLSPSTYAGPWLPDTSELKTASMPQQRALPGEGGRAQVAVLLTVAEDKDDVIAQPRARP